MIRVLCSGCSVTSITSMLSSATILCQSSSTEAEGQYSAARASALARVRFQSAATSSPRPCRHPNGWRKFHRSRSCRCGAGRLSAWADDTAGPAPRLPQAHVTSRHRYRCRSARRSWQQLKRPLFGCGLDCGINDPLRSQAQGGIKRSFDRRAHGKAANRVFDGVPLPLP